MSGNATTREKPCARLSQGNGITDVNQSLADMDTELHNLRFANEEQQGRIGDLEAQLIVLRREIHQADDKKGPSRTSPSLTQVVAPVTCAGERMSIGSPSLLPAIDALEDRIRKSMNENLKAFDVQPMPEWNDTDSPLDGRLDIQESVAKDRGSSKAVVKPINTIVEGGESSKAVVKPSKIIVEGGESSKAVVKPSKIITKGGESSKAVVKGRGSSNTAAGSAQRSVLKKSGTVSGSSAPKWMNSRW